MQPSKDGLSALCLGAEILFSSGHVNGPHIPPPPLPCLPEASGGTPGPRQSATAARLRRGPEGPLKALE